MHACRFRRELPGELAWAAPLLDPGHPLAVRCARDQARWLIVWHHHLPNYEQVSFSCERPSTTTAPVAMHHPARTPRLQDDRVPPSGDRASAPGRPPPGRDRPTGLMLGPHHPKPGTGTHLVCDALTGKMPMVPNAVVPISDVRDLATATARTVLRRAGRGATCSAGLAGFRLRHGGGSSCRVLIGWLPGACPGGRRVRVR